SSFGRRWHGGLPSLPGLRSTGSCPCRSCAGLAAGWLGAMVSVLALALLAWAIVTITRGGSDVPTHLPTATIVESGPYRFTPHPIYLRLFLGLICLALSFHNIRLLIIL